MNSQDYIRVIALVVPSLPTTKTYSTFIVKLIFIALNYVLTIRG